jgi:hypothetical protein
MTFDIRSSILNTKPKTQDVSTPFWSQKDENGVEQVDGHLALQDIPGDDLADIVNGAPNRVKGLAGILCSSLINKDTGLPVFTMADRDTVAHMGTSELLPLFAVVEKFFALGKNASIDEKKGNSGQTLPSTGIPASPMNAYIKP